MNNNQFKFYKYLLTFKYKRYHLLRIKPVVYLRHGKILFDTSSKNKKLPLKLCDIGGWFDDR
jgi:hypothetical protein